MTKEILRCIKCGNYTMEKICKCGSECLSPKPPKWSPEDKYSRYRLEYKKNERK
jgi:H/ACA ribonucleoprotein complex subunit 3